MASPMRMLSGVAALGGSSAAMASNMAYGGWDAMNMAYFANPIYSFLLNNRSEHPDSLAALSRRAVELLCCSFRRCAIHTRPPPSPASTTAPRPARRPLHCRGPTRARCPDACAPRLLSSPACCCATVTPPCPSRPWPGRGPSCPGRTRRESCRKSRPAHAQPAAPSPYHRRVHA